MSCQMWNWALAVRLGPPAPEVRWRVAQRVRRLVLATLLVVGATGIPLSAGEGWSYIGTSPTVLAAGAMRPGEQVAPLAGFAIGIASTQDFADGPGTVRISTLDALYDTLSKARGGETILLEGGNYGDLYLGNLSSFDVAFPDMVTVASADPEDPAIFATAQIRFVSNLTLDGVVFDYTYAPGDTLRTYPFEVQKSGNVTIRNATFDGDLASGLSAAEDGYGFSNGLYCRDSTGLTVETSRFVRFQRGLVLVSCSQMSIIGNDISAMRMDGMNLVNVQNVRVEGNHIHDFNGRPGWEDHRDMIQFWTNGTDTPSTDIIIRNNVLNSGTGSYTQSIFMRNEEVDTGRAGSEMFYRNVEISGNVILNAHLHGITVGETDGLKIVNNTIVRNPRSEGPGRNASVWTPRINVASAAREVKVLRNVTSAIEGQGRRSDWEIRDNLLAQDRNPRLAYYYLDVFGPAALEDPIRIESFIPRPGGPLDGTGIGAPRLMSRPAPSQD